MPRAYSYLRMSSAEQLRGDSLRRQLEQSKAYARKHGLELAEDIRDIGISAFRGANAAEGALAQFLTAVRKKKVPAGSFLLIENLDRLSRQQVFKAFGIFSEIVSAGVKIVTLTDQRVYDSELDLGDMIMSVVSLERAHQESKMRSVRIAAAWKNKRANASKTILTGKSKGWLRPRADKSGFDPIRERVKIIKQIFADAADFGMGADLIARKLNETRVPTFIEHGRGWHKTYILRILKDRSVLGEMTPHVMVEGERRPTDQVIANYYPAIISESTFHRVAAALSKRRQAGGGRKGDRVANLFSKIIFCSACGSPIHMINRGGKSGQSIVCDGARRRVSPCKPTYWLYPHFERSFLTFVREIDLISLTTTTAQAQRRPELEQEIQAVEGKMREAEIKRERLLQLILGDEPTTFLKDNLRETDVDVADLQKKLAGLIDLRKTMAHEEEAAAASSAQLAELIDRVQAKADFKLRAALADHLKNLIGKILVQPKSWSSASKVGRHFIVHFRNGSRRVVYPSAEDPTKFIGFGHTREGIITDPLIRFLLAWYGITDPKPEQYDEMTTDLTAAGRKRAELGDAALMPLHEKWEKHRAGPNKSVGTLVEMQKKYRELGLD